MINGFMKEEVTLCGKKTGNKLMVGAKEMEIKKRVSIGVCQMDQLSNQFLKE